MVKLFSFIGRIRIFLFGTNPNKTEMLKHQKQRNYTNFTPDEYGRIIERERKLATTDKKQKLSVPTLAPATTPIITLTPAPAHIIAKQTQIVNTPNPATTPIVKPKPAPTPVQIKQKNDNGNNNNTYANGKHKQKNTTEKQPVNAKSNNKQTLPTPKGGNNNGNNSKNNTKRSNDAPKRKKVNFAEQNDNQIKSIINDKKPNNGSNNNLNGDKKSQTKNRK